MNKKIYRQYDSRWGNLPYPSKPYTLSRSGCGCVAVTHCAIERDKYKNYTPKDVRKFMVKYATKGHGTEWAGIKKGLEHYGYNVHWVKREDPMSDVWKYLKGSLNRGVILFGSTKGADGTVWTTDGHFIAFTAYKIEKGKHWFYLKDSGGRKHDGWYCYEKSMKGDVRQVWICTSLKTATKSTTAAKKTATSTKTSTAKKTTSTAAKKAPVKQTSQQKLIAKMKELAWAYGTPEKKYKYKTGAPKKVCKTAMKKYGWADNKAELSDCGNFVSTVVRESGVSKTFKALHGVKTPFPKCEKGFTIVHKGKKIPSGVLKAGDIIRYKKTNGKQHAMFYFGDGKVCEASHHNLFGVIRKDTKRYNTQSKASTIQVLRAK